MSESILTSANPMTRLKQHIGTILQIFLLFWMLAIFAWALADHMRGAQLTWLLPFCALGLTAGWILARSRKSGLVAGLILFMIYLVVMLLRVGHLGKSLLSLLFGHPGGASHLALAYDHFVAGGDSIPLLLRDIAERYTGAVPAEAGLQPPERYPATYRGLLLRHPLWMLKGLTGLPRMVGSARRSFRPRYGSPDDQYNAFKLFSLGPGALNRLRNAGRAWGVTFNDLLMASVLQAIAPLAPEHAR